MKAHWNRTLQLFWLIGAGCGGASPGAEAVEPSTAREALALMRPFHLAGTLGYGQTVIADGHAQPVPTEALVFAFDGAAGDPVEVTVESLDGGRPVVWLLDEEFVQLARANGDGPLARLSATMPQGEAARHYVAIRDAGHAPRRFQVTIDQRCDGFVVHPHHCPAGLRCVHGAVPDLPGRCLPTCGGIIGERCAYPGDFCQFDASCDPAHGGADCSGVCAFCDPRTSCPSGAHLDPATCTCTAPACVRSELCVRTAHWDPVACRCVQN